MNPTVSQQTVCVSGSRDPVHAELMTLASSVGDLLARMGVNLVTSGGAGLIAAVIDGFTNSVNRSGIAIGILPRPAPDSAECLPQGSHKIDLTIQTHLLDGFDGGLNPALNEIKVLSSVAVVALPGWDGTAIDVRLAVRHDKPVIILTHDLRIVRDLPKSIPRVCTVAEVAAFLRKTLAFERKRRALPS